MKILLFGKNGQVGWELNRSLQSLGEVVALGRDEADFSDPESLRNIVCNIKPDVIVNSVAYTAVDKAEDEEEQAIIINGIAPGVLAEEALKINALLVHYSTDYVFDGAKESPYVETDEPNPINAYGRTKLAGEIAIQKSGCKFYIFRSSWVYSARGHNFLKSILRLASERKTLNVVNDQVGAPTEASMIADKTAEILSGHGVDNKFVSNVYHLTSLGVTSWCEFAKTILKCFQENNDLPLFDDLVVNPVTSESFNSKAKRPINSCLDTNKIQKYFNLQLPQWEVSLSCFVQKNIKALQDSD